MSGRDVESKAAVRHAHHRRWTLPSWWIYLAAILAAAYIVLTVAVVIGSPVNAVDEFWYQQHLVPDESSWHSIVTAWVFIGRRAPATVIVGIYIAYRWWRTRNLQPVVLLVFAWLAFNASVGAMKYLTGRVGPRYTSDAYTAWSGGDIFPSGHVTGAVVLYGVVALTAPIAWRRLMTGMAVLFSVTVGFGTVALNTHWFSDVIGAWIDGSLVLLISWAVVPVLTPVLERLFVRAKIYLTSHVSVQRPAQPVHLRRDINH